MMSGAAALYGYSRLWEFSITRPGNSSGRLVMAPTVARSTSWMIG